MIVAGRPGSQVLIEVERQSGGIATASLPGSTAASPIEGINALVPATKAKASGYRNRETLKATTDLVACKSDLNLTTSKRGKPSLNAPIALILTIFLTAFTEEAVSSMRS
jgi:hypothetical protein